MAVGGGEGAGVVEEFGDLDVGVVVAVLAGGAECAEGEAVEGGGAGVAGGEGLSVFGEG